MKVTGSIKIAILKELYTDILRHQMVEILQVTGRSTF